MCDPDQDKPLTKQQLIDAAKVAFLRRFCDVYFPEIVNLALGGNADAFWLIVFSARPELQTPDPDELFTYNYWQAAIHLEPVLMTEVSTPPA